MRVLGQAAKELSQMFDHANKSLDGFVKRPETRANASLLKKAELLQEMLKSNRFQQVLRSSQSIKALGGPMKALSEIPTGKDLAEDMQDLEKGLLNLQRAGIATGSLLRQLVDSVDA